MKIMHEYIDFPGGSPIKVKWRDIPHFSYPWHFHKEYELCYVIKSYGLRYVGDSIESFGPGDLVLTGSNLPHFWKSDESFHQRKTEKRVKAIVIQFQADFFINALNDYSEFYHIKKLLKLSNQGVSFNDPVVKKVDKLLLKMVEIKGFDRIILILQILDILAKSNSYKVLGSEIYHPKINENTTDRLAKVVNYLNYHYREVVPLEKVSGLAGLHPSAFCRYFKEKTGKTLSEFISDMRIGYACKLLIEGHLSVSQICFESGFNNLSNFNRTFKRITKSTPSEYQQQFHKKNKSLQYSFENEEGI